MANNTTSGAIVTLLPDDEYRSYRPMTVDPHLTVVYFGAWTDLDPGRVNEYWDSMVGLWTASIDCEVTAETWFSNNDGSEWAHVDLINAPYLPDFRSVAQEMADIHGLPVARDFGFLPHITRRYMHAARQIEHVHRPVKPQFKLDKMALWVGPSRREVVLGE